MLPAPFIRRSAAQLLSATLILGTFALPEARAQATAPSQTPLLTTQAGAKPNLMIALDNSGSMAFTYHETYNVTTDDEYQRRYCPDPYSRSSSTNSSTFNAGIGQEANVTAGTPPVYTCYQRVRSGFSWITQARTNVSLPYSPDQSTWNWSAQRSADVNPIYYNPRVRYLPRVDGNGAVINPRDPRLPASDPAYNVAWISNQNSANFRYVVYQRSTSPNDYRVYHSMYASNAGAPPSGSTATRNFQGYVNTLAPTGFTSRYDLNYTQRIPQHIAYTSAPTASDATTFTYAYCSAVVTNASGQQTGCSARTRVDVRLGDTATYTIPTPNTRTDCTASVCTNDQEVTNILNWYRWYSTRQLATSTAIGLALADTDANGERNEPSQLDGNLRIGYMPINQDYSQPLATTPGSGSPVTLSRGVRPIRRNSTDNTNLFNWLNGILPQGGTPLHYAIGRAADYYGMASGVTENPWRTNPTDSSSPEMSCRRSFNLLFSDGAWTASGGVWNPTTPGPDYDNTNGPTFTRTLANGNTESFSYQRHGVNTPVGRRAYTPFPGTATGGVADLTAQYFWHTDLRASLANDVQTRPGQPTFWQNMATYTVGYLIRPSGEVPGATSGLTFDQITDYQSQYAANGYTAATKPSWPTGNLISSGSDQARVDDFIQAGYSGGGRGFSAQTADDVRSIFNTVLSDILNQNGRDAGVAVSTAAADLSTIAGRLKYGVSYRTIDNTGEITAQELDENGDVVGERWNASERIPAHNARNVFTMSGTQTPHNFTGRFDALPSDVRAALSDGPDASRIPADARFVNYLRGLDPVTDTAGVLFRQRSAPLGAMVNPPSIYMGGDRDFAYDLSGTVDGSGSYLAYANAKRDLPASLFVATNAGMMHALSAETGDELAAFMPRRSLRRMLNYANANYTFEYTLDGPMSEHDIYDGANWHHLAIGTGGRGEKLIYGVRSPLNQTGTANRNPGLSDFVWETGPDLIDTGTLTLGHLTTAVRSGQTAHGEWIAITTSGHYNGRTDGARTGLVVLNAMTGEVIRTIPLPGGYDAGRGLGGVTLVRNEDKRIVAAYAGDANGHLWRFDLRGAPATWGVSYGQPLFTTANNRPIYGAPAWQSHPNGGAIVVVATGILLEDTDLAAPPENESIYGIWDPTRIGEADATPFTPAAVGDLLTQTVLTGSDTTLTSGSNTFFQSSRDAIDWNVHRGWTMALGRTPEHAGERSIDQIRNLGTSVIIATAVVDQPLDPDAEMCSASSLPANYIYILNALDGGTRRSFDVDGDGRLDNVSVVLVSEGGYARGMAVANTMRSSEMTDAIRRQLAPDSNAGESQPTPQRCSPVTSKLLGTEAGALSAGVACDVAGWSRNQYQLSRPPSSN